MKTFLISAIILLSAVLPACSDERTKGQDTDIVTEQRINTDSNAAAAPTVDEHMPTLPSFTIQDVIG